tara:strand:+ start:334 stop:558 length:225 start_codon:yes stop_codon:yes gene_type:complete
MERKESDIELNEIVWCNLKFKHNNKILYLMGVVYKRKSNGMYFKKRMLDPMKINVPIEVVQVQVLKRLGYGSTE